MGTARTEAFDVIVIGAGPGGSALSAILAKEGLKVLLVEKNSRAGGKMLSMRRDGFTYEMFPINGVPARNSLFEKLIGDLGLEEPKAIYPDPIGRFYFELPNGEIRRMEQRAKASPFGFKRLMGLSWGDFFRFLKAMGAMVAATPTELEGIARLSFLDYLKRFELPQSAVAYLAVAFCEGYFQTAPDRISAAAIVRAVQQTRKYGGGRYYEGGIGSVFEAFAHSAEHAGATLLFRTRADRIVVEDGAVAGIVADGHRYSAPVVVSSAGIQATVLKLVGPEYFEPDYLKFVQGLEGNLSSAGFRWVLDAPLLTSPMNIYAAADTVNTFDDFRAMEKSIFPEHTYVYLGTTSLYPGMAPKGKQLVYACMSCLPDPRLRIEPYLELVRKTVAKMQPDIFDHIEREETFGPSTVSELSRESVLPGVGGEDYGVALSPEQYGDERLNGGSPIQGLFYVGCDAGGFGLGTHQAVDSAFNVAEMVRRYRGGQGL
jgi:phytoene dehydrogenase-like protein